MHQPVERAPLADLTGLVGKSLAGKVAQTLEDQALLAERDAHNLEVLREKLGRKPTIVVPELAGDVHDLAGLAAMREHLCFRR